MPELPPDRNSINVDIRTFAPEQRMLLLPHCLRPSQGCPGRMTPQGLDCSGCTRTDCKIYPIRQAALDAGYRDVCVAPGGRLAVSPRSGRRQSLPWPVTRSWQKASQR